MYTQCPKCQVHFRVTRAQLEARDGLVRCGNCQAVFRATDRLLDSLPETEPAKRTAATTPPSPKPRRPRRRARGATASAGDAQSVAPLLYPVTSRGERARRIGWSALVVLLACGALAQLAFLYRMQLAQHGALRPLLEEACAWLDCTLDPPHEFTRIEFETSIAPHPRYANLLRVRADLVNRSARAQPYPLLEVALTDRDGRTLARRRFRAREYLAPPARAGDALLPNVVAHGLLDLTNPDNRAVGYEIRLLPHE